VYLTDYTLRLYAGRGYAAGHGLPHRVQDLRGHRFVSYVESALQVSELAHSTWLVADDPAAFQATSIFAQVEAVRADAGIALLPEFMAYGRDGLVPVLHRLVERRLRIWAAARPEAMRSAAVQAVVQSLLDEVGQRQAELLRGLAAPEAREP
jgi:DNA-binding transcriptional LysR family regulator